MKTPNPLRILTLTQDYSVCQLNCEASIASFVFSGEFFSVTKTQDELSIVCETSLVPLDATAVETGWRCLKVEGPLDFSLTGILSTISTALADQKISLFATSTFDTDYILVKADQLARAEAALRHAGFNL